MSLSNFSVYFTGAAPSIPAAGSLPGLEDYPVGALDNREGNRFSAGCIPSGSGDDDGGNEFAQTRE